MTNVTATELLDLAGRMRAAKNLLRAVVRTPALGPIRVRHRAKVRTHDRMGSGAWQPGDPLRLLVLRELANRNQMVVKTYHAFSEAFGQIVLDTAPGLLGGPEVGPFAVKLAFALAAAIAWERQPVSVSYLRGVPPVASADRPSRLPALATELAAVEPERADPATLPERLRADLGNPRANANVFLVTHPGHPVERMERILRELSARARRAAVFAPVAEYEFDDTREVTDPNTGARAVLPVGAGAALATHLNELVELGAAVGVPVWPLIVREHRADLDTILPQLAGLI